MGGNAFKVHLPNASFQRMSPRVYYTLKAALKTRLLKCYDVVETPAEAPEKPDHGDIDFLVAYPRPGLTDNTLQEQMKSRYSIMQPGFRTSNFAIPLHAFLPELLHADAKGAPSNAPETEEYCQADVHVCPDKDTLDRLLFVQSYGDMMQILGIMARGIGLSFGQNGLKLADPLPTSPPMTFYLSISLSHILDFYGLNIDRWRQGFNTQRELFNWVISSRLFDAHRIMQYSDAQTSKAKLLKDRMIYQNFIIYIKEQLEAGAAAGLNIGVEDALRFFGKEVEYNAVLENDRARRRAKELLNGVMLQELTGLKGMPVKLLSDGIKQRLEEAWSCENVTTYESQEAVQGYSAPLLWEIAVAEKSEEEVRAMVLRVKEEMQAAGQLDFDWKAAKARKEQRKMEVDHNVGAI
ncbi:hypothetical protein OBBRIDRAFT_825069 [Obba rivulosa]|uniref:Uncharacterized protein n=1 Tax=Obba rivulosa TaxID=1052685 RepID=A0A8E2B0U8_9APHY|nr:hypothetical protein OBBRIDRAFT_825069 [Obba rivulosa]